MTRMERKRKRINTALNISIVIAILLALLTAFSLFGEMKDTYSVYQESQETLERSQRYRQAAELRMEQRAAERGEKE